jgi:hypothetical protein
MSENQPAVAGTGFRISDEPVVPARSSGQPAAASTEATSAGDVACFNADDSLCILARDPRSLFVYWSWAWAERTALRPLHLRILREDESEETTREIDPISGFSFVEVGSPSANYTCELGLFEDEEWRSLVRSDAARTPAATMSDDLSADFATLPIHLSFQRLIEIFRAAPKGRTPLAEAVGEMQSEARTLQASMSATEWLNLVDAAASKVEGGAAFGLNEARPSEMAALLCTVKQDEARIRPTPEKLAAWQALGERFGGSSWAGGSSAGSSEAFSGSSQ